VKYYPQWDKCDASTLLRYVNYLDQHLSSIDVPYDIIMDAMPSDSPISVKKIDKFYNDIISCVNMAVQNVIPSRKAKLTRAEYIMPGWNTHVKEKHSLARDAFIAWAETGKFRQGPIYDQMRVTRARFKLALRYCKQNQEALKADALASSLANNDTSKFWSEISKQTNSNVVNNVLSIGGICGANNIANMWKEHFSKLYNREPASVHRSIFENKLEQSSFYSETLNSSPITLTDVIRSLKLMKKGKSPGPDGLHTEAFMFGGHRLCLYLCFLFNLFLKYGYVPSSFSSTVAY